jgi:hypothetical protein
MSDIFASENPGKGQRVRAGSAAMLLGAASLFGVVLAVSPAGATLSEIPAAPRSGGAEDIDGRSQRLQIGMVRGEVLASSRLYQFSSTPLNYPNRNFQFNQTRLPAYNERFDPSLLGPPAQPKSPPPKR